VILDKFFFVFRCSDKMQNTASAKRKEIYKYEAPWTVYGMNWSVRPDKRFRLALGSFLEEYNNKVSDPDGVGVFELDATLFVNS
jgi:hypothetical protein